MLRMIWQGLDRQATAPEKARTRELPLTPHLTDQTIQMARRNSYGWDVYALKGDFDGWLLDTGKVLPDDYQKAFYGFAKQYHERNRS